MLAQPEEAAAGSRGSQRDDPIAAVSDDMREPSGPELRSFGLCGPGKTLLIKTTVLAGGHGNARAR